MLLGQKLSRTATRNTRALVPRTLYVLLFCLHLSLVVSHLSPPPRFRGRSITTIPLLDFAQRHVSKGVNHLAEDVFVKGKGSWVTTHGGRRLLDFTSGIGVTNLGASGGIFCHHSALNCENHLGHCHPKVSKAAADQCLNLVHGQVVILARLVPSFTPILSGGPV